ncbi:sarcocystatin-A-like [Drosophila bipectinata]|uniref:sarcocystatin-A-like n=1 Tax=Drosophila bipectinata TaxID=42026 RepID=UPI001C8A7871|nr:sarcocystatin-A-like [Drosophila bipectinata]
MFLAKLLLLCTACVLVIGNPEPFGGFTKLEGQALIDAQQLLNTALAKMDSGDGPHYRLLRVVEAYSRVVEGTSYKFTAVLIDENDVQKICQVDILNRILNLPMVVTVKCPNEAELTKQQSA